MGRHGSVPNVIDVGGYMIAGFSSLLFNEVLDFHRVISVGGTLGSGSGVRTGIFDGLGEAGETRAFDR